MRLNIGKYKFNGIYRGNLIVTTKTHNIIINLNTHQILQFKRRKSQWLKKQCEI